MNRLLVGALALAMASIPGTAQSLDDLNIQIHGYATQGFLYSTQNNVFTTHSSNGSPAWSEAVMNVSAQPIPKLRIGVQARYFLLGNFGDSITLDWAAADYKVNEKFGVRFGKVKIPTNLFNETQDIDPSYMWALLPQSVYTLPDRDSQLSQYGGVVYGTLKLGENLGKMEYRGWGGYQVYSSGDGYWIALREAGMSLPNGLSGTDIGAALHWKTPLHGLMIGGSDMRKPAWSAPLTFAPAPGELLKGSMDVKGFNEWAIFGIYEKNKVMIAGEYNKLAPEIMLSFPNLPIPFPVDKRQWYGMASYKVTGKLTAGIYNSQQINHALPLSTGPSRSSKDWVVSGRYDFNQYIYAKAEEHFINGTDNYYDEVLNPDGLKPTTKLNLLKLGVSF
jgi:hypothetical protein